MIRVFEKLGFERVETVSDAFELPDGTVADTKGALVWLDAQDSLEQEVDTNDE